jgi:Rod binding domain-containing protein
MVRVKIGNDQKSVPAAQKINPVKPYEDIAEGMEATFTQHMLAEMRKSVPKEGADTPAMDYYNSLLDSERAQLMAKSNTGLGVKKVILDQIVPQNMKHYLKNSHQEVAQGMTASPKEKKYE